MKSLTNKLIVYDSNCKVCSSLRNIVARFTSIPEEKIKAYKDLSPELTGNVDPEKFKNVMALIDTAGGETMYGSNGIAYALASEYKTVEVLFRFRPAFNVFNYLYKIQAYNRYIIATPKSTFQCDCLPDRVLKYRLGYIAVTLILSVVLTAAFGISLQTHFPLLTQGEAAMQMLLIAGTGWVLQILLSLAILGGKALDYIGHLGSIMVVGLLILVPSMVIQMMAGPITIWLPAASVACSSGYMLYLHMNRAKHLGLSGVWTLSWFLLLQSTALLWIYIFHQNYIL